MISEEQKNRLTEQLQGKVFFNEPLANHSTIKIGGTADAYVIPENVDEFVKIVTWAKENEIEVFFIGAGSNVLFRDAGFEGIVISSASLNKFGVKNKDESGILVTAEAGVLINDLVNFAISESVSGFEYLAGIPGTVGGALSMNAGTHGGVISDPLVEVLALDRAGKVYQWTKDKLEFAYRKTKFPRSCMVLSSDFYLKNGAREEIEARASELRERRRNRHPLSWPSLGSVFKNPRQGPSAGQLVEEAGLKGVRVGGARIANEHANWIINENNATAKDVEVLVHLVREKVKESSEVVLEPEIIIVGRKNE